MRLCLVGQMRDGGHSMKRFSFAVLVFVVIFLIPMIPTTNPVDRSKVQNPYFEDVPTLADGLIGLNGTGDALLVTIKSNGTIIDSNYTGSTTYYVTNATTVDWTADVLVSPPSGAQNIEVDVNFPQTEWRPVSVTNPNGTVKSYPTDWYYEGGVLTIRSSAVDVFGVWKIKFVAMNYVSNVLVGPNGGPFSTTTTMNINDVLAVRATTPWVTGASVNLVLTDPSGSEWYRTSLTTTGSSVHEVPSFRYRKPLTINAAQVSADLTNFPVLVRIYDSDLHNTSKCQSDGDDILFVQNGKVLAHDLELFDQTFNSTHALLVAWVRANLSSSVDTTITMYYGNPVVGPQENPKKVWDGNYAAVWHLGENAVDESNTAIHYDSTSGGYDGNQDGNARGTGIAGYGQAFDGTNDLINVTESEGLNPSGSLTISGWFYLSSPFSSSSSTSMLIMSKYFSSTNDMHIALVGQDYSQFSVTTGSLVFKVENSNNQKYIWTTKSSWSAGWYHFSVYMNATNPSSNKIYINGAEDTSGVTVGGATWCNLTYSADWGIGGGLVDGQFPSSPAYFTGNLDEFRVGLGSRSAGWISTEYNNQADPDSFYSVGTEGERVSPEHTFTKTIDSTAGAGIWTASVFYNDTGTGVDNRTGIYEREFLVKHDSSLTLISPGDAVGDGVSLKVAGEMLYVEVELTDDVNSNTIAGSTVKMSWWISGTPTNITLNDYGTGRYGIALNTTDLGTNQRWTLNIYSSHPYYNDATTSFYLDLNHDTELTYQNVESTPVGQDFTATLIFTDTYDNTPITGATITFANGTPVTVVSQGNGMYNISVPTNGLSFGTHWYIFNATKSGAYLEDASVNVTFTLRPHYTTVSITGDLVTPYGFNTDVTVVLIDSDTGTTIGIGDVSSMTFTWATGSHSENPATSFNVTLPTNTWSVGNTAVTLSVVMSNANYYAPSDYTFDVTIRNHYTSVSVSGDFVTPVGFGTDVTVVIVDLDTGNPLAATDVSSLTFTSSYPSYGVSNPLSLDLTLPTENWALGTETVTLAVVMKGNYDAPANYQFDITIRKHYTSVTVNGDLVTPYGFTTDVTIVITDLDTGTQLTSADVASFQFNPQHYTFYNESNPTDLAVTLATNTWSVGTEPITLDVAMQSNYSAPSTYSFSIQIRNHYTAASVTGGLVTPYGQNTPLTVVITDLDTNTQVAASYVSQLQFTSTYGTQTESGPFANLDITLTTNTWDVGAPTVTLSVTLSGNYDPPSNYDFTVTIRNHYTSATVIGDLVTPYGFSTTVTIVVTDLDTGTNLTAGDVNTFTFTASYGTYGETNPLDLIYTIDTTSWNVGTVSVTLSITLNGNYDPPSNYDFSIVIRNHYTSATVTGGLTTPMGNKTPVTVVITDLDTNSVLAAGDVASVTFTSSYGSDAPTGPYSSLDFLIDTSSWAVGTETVTLSVTLNGNYDPPSNYDFDINIVGLSTYLYHEPNDLIFPNGDAFKIIIRVNISEPGPYYGGMVTGLVHANFTVHNSTYTYPFTLTEIAPGRYNLSIAASYFPEGSYSITVEFNPTNVTLKPSQLVIAFTYRPARSELSSPDRAVTTPYQTDYNVTLTFTDVDRSSGITGATITAQGVIIYNIVDLGNGNYRVSINTTLLAKGEHLYNLTADKAGYEAQTLSFKVVVRIAYTSAIPTVGALDIPVGNDPVFYVEFRDIDHDVPITPESPFTISTTWIHPITWEYLAGEGRYRITFPTEIDDTLQQNLVVTFNFSKGENYQFGIFNISVTIRTHNTDLRLVTAVEPTSSTSNITIYLFYGDLDDQVGIWSKYVSIRVENETQLVIYYVLNDTARGEGYYEIRVPAGQFKALGLQNFTITYNWTGPVYSYQNRSIFVQANIVGEDSSYTLISASEPTPYLGNMSYTFFYSELYSGQGITNTTGHVRVYVVFQGLSVDMSQVDIWEVDPVSSPGNYSIQFNTTIFGRVGVIYMEVHVEWEKGVEPFYTNRTDIITVRVLSRDTLVSVVPPLPTAWAENATFTFTYEDVTGSSSVAIAYDVAKMTISMSLTDYVWTFNSTTNVFTVSFNTSQLSGLGQKSFTLSVIWTGSPFYANQTDRVIYVSVVSRQTIVDFTAPPPTAYSDIVTFSVTYLDIVETPAVGVPDYTFALYYAGSPIPGGYYTTEHDGFGTVTVHLNTSWFSTPGTYTLNASFTYSGTGYYDDAWSTRELQLRFRSTILSNEPVNSIGYGAALEIVLYYQDMLTFDNIGSFTTLVILNNTGTPWNYTLTWRSSTQNYLLVVQTNDQSFSVGQEYVLWVNMSYAYVSPFYLWDDAYISFRVINRTTSLEVLTAPLPTSYAEYNNFKVFYKDIYTDGGISGGTILLKTDSGFISSSYYYYTESSGTYTVYLNTSALVNLGKYVVTVYANWGGGAPFYDNALVNISVSVVERTTNVEIISPPSSTKYLDNITFTFAYTDTITGELIQITANDIVIYGNGTPLSSGDFVMNQVGSVFEISINTTVLSNTLVSDYNLTISVDWNAGTAPYYADDTTSLRLSTRGRTMMIEVGSIDATPLNDNMTITFTVSDDSNGRSIDNAIVLFDCVEVSLTEGTSYWLNNDGGGSYTILVDTAFLGNIGDFHFELTVQWDPAVVPYYANRSTINLIGSVNLIWAVLTSDLPTPSSVQISEDVYVLVYYRDYDHGQAGITGVSFTVRYLDTGTVPQNLQINMLSPGVYNISFSTIDITDTGSKTLNITATLWPYTPSSVQPSFTVKVIDTALTALETSIQVNWTDTVRVTVEFEDLLHGNLTAGATVSCVWGGSTLYFTESATPGQYFIDIDTGLEDSGTRVLTVTASKNKFSTSITTVTLIVLTLPSSIVPIEPAGLVQSGFRGEGVNVTIYLNNTYGNAPVGDSYVVEVTGVFEGNGKSYTFTYNGTPGYYEAVLPGSDTASVDVGFYYFRITVKLQNFNPASYQFTVELQQTRTLLLLDTASGTSEEITRYYSEVVHLAIWFSELANESSHLTNASVVWYISDLSIGGNMTEDPSYPGLYYTDLDTTLPGYGIWAITFRAIPDDAQFSNAITSLTLTVKRIPTQVFGPDPLTKPWGWIGNLSFVYWDEVFDRPIIDATARFSWGPYTGVDAIDLGNGTYIVPVDTTVLLPEIKWSITISFSKPNFVESNGAVQLTIELIKTTIDVLAPEKNQVEDSSRNLIVPMGDLLNITIYYGDVEMYVGGISGATLTSDSELRGDTFSGGRAVEIIDLGNGYYSFIFDTKDPQLFEYTNGTPVTGQSYRLIVGLHLDNRTTQEVTIRIRIIDIPTAFVATISSPTVSLVHEDSIVIDIFYNDTWHGEGVVADFLSAVSNNEGVIGVTVAPGTETGHYTVTLTATGVGTALVTINLGSQYYSNVTLTYAVQVLPNQTDVLVQQATTIGLPISLFVILLLGLYVKVWSVPKRVRQINGQIRALRKGRVPKPIGDAKGRTELLADLFNDTYIELGITRTPDQLPEESVQVEIPEMGELLMQLSILTHLSPEELDEFKADISKMKLSEQAAFVKEVIHQEAIRAARRDGKTVDEVLEEIAMLAKRRLGEMEGGETYVSGPSEHVEDSIILRPEPETVTHVEPERVFRPSEPEVTPTMSTEEEIPVTPSDRLSPFELEELRKKLMERGVPPHEIDTIIEQAKNLSRELVDELVRSLTGEE